MSQDNRQQSSNSQNQGEGDRAAAKRYNEQTQEFVESGKVEQAARKAADQDPEESRRSEDAGKARAKEEDPALQRDYSKAKQ